MKRKAMNVKAMLWLIVVLLQTLCFAAACQPNPEEDIVINKGDAALDQAIRQTASPETLQYAAPTTLTEVIETDATEIIIEANVSVPAITEFGVYKVKMSELSQEKADEFILNLLGKGPYYDAGATKEQYDALIVHTRQSIYDIENMSAENFRAIYEETESKESVLGILNEELANYYALREQAPSSADKIPIDTMFTIEDTMKSLDIACEMENGFAKLSLFANNEQISNDTQTNYYYEYQPISPNATLTISLEEAEELAMNFLDRIGVYDRYTFVKTEKILSIEDRHRYDVRMPPASNDTQYYVMDFARVRDGLPAKYILHSGGTSSEAEEYAYFPHPEIMQLLVNDDGVISFVWQNPDDDAETLNHASSLLAFEEIEAIIKNNSMYEKWLTPESKLHITDIILHGMRMKAPNEEGRYVVLPVWDIVGKMEYTDSDPAIKGELPALSYLTINALDGSIINRDIGY